MSQLKSLPLRLREFRLDRQQVFAFLRSDYLKLAAILGLAFYIAFIPHSDYPYPVHLDEWTHMANSNAIMEAGDVDAEVPYLNYSVKKVNLEAGFHLLLGLFNSVSGISWIAIFRYMPAIVFMFTVLAVYLLGKRLGFGWEAALMTCLMITTVGIMGPGFLVPVAFALPFVAIFIYLAFSYRHAGNYLTLAILMSLILCLHPPTALGLGIIMGPYVLLNLRNHFYHALGLSLSMFLPLLPALIIVEFDVVAHYLEGLFQEGKLASHVLWPVLVRDYGYIPTFLTVGGVILLVRRRDDESKALAFALILLLTVLVLYSQFQYGMVLMYNRGLHYTMLVMGIIGGCCLSALRRVEWSFHYRNIKVNTIAHNFGSLLCLATIVAIFIVAIPDRKETPYYHMINYEDYAAFNWIRKNLDEEYETAILNPWKGAAFQAITGRSTYSLIRSVPDKRTRNTYNFFSSGCVDTELLRKNHISIIYNDRRCDNPDLVQVRNYVYILEGDSP